MTNFYLSYSIKLTLFTFINSSIIPLVSNYVYNNGDYDLLVIIIKAEKKYINIVLANL